MNEAIAGAAIALGLLALLVIAGYNKLVTRRQRIDESWSNVDTELKRRHDLVPNLVQAVKGYANHEKTLMEDLARARALEGAPAARERADAEQRLAADVTRALVAVAEAYPDLKASEPFLRLQRELAETEDRIQAARRFFNANVRDYNNTVEQFPTNLLAQAFGHSTRDYFELPSPDERAAPTVRT